MKRLLLFALFCSLMAACSQKPHISQCLSRINESLQSSAVQVMSDMHVKGIVLVIDSASNVVINAGVQDSLEMSDAEVYGWLSMMINPGNIFRPMLLAAILDADSMNQKFLEKECRCGRISIENVVIADHGTPLNAIGKMNVKSALQTGSNAAWCDFCYNIYPDVDSRAGLAGTLSRMLPQCVPFKIDGLISQSAQDFIRVCTGYGVLLQPYTIAFYYNALVNQGGFRLIEEDCSYRYETIVGAHVAEEVVDLLREQTTRRVGLHGTLMDTTANYPSYIGYTTDLKYTVLVMLDESSNTAIAKRIFDSILNYL